VVRGIIVGMVVKNQNQGRDRYRFGTRHGRFSNFPLFANSRFEASAARVEASVVLLKTFDVRFKISATLSKTSSTLSGSVSHLYHASEDIHHGR
jgi:hypothetical protein